VIGNLLILVLAVGMHGLCATSVAQLADSGILIVTVIELLLRSGSDFCFVIPIP